MNELLGLGSGTFECAPPEQSLRAHDVHDEDVSSVKPVKDSARRFNYLTIAGTRAEFSGATATFWVICELPNVLDDPLD